MSTPSSGLLFEVAPAERDGQTKKKPKNKPRKVSEVQHVSTASEWVPDDRPFMASIDGHHQCERCGMTVLDLADVRKVDGKVQWLLQCAWGCLAMQFVDPIPGIIEKIDEEETKKDVFQVRGGRFDGQTFDEIDAGGHRWYIEQLVKAAKRTHLADAAARWLTKNR